MLVGLACESVDHFFTSGHLLSASFVKASSPGIFATTLK
jgi:hypothetical protein